MIYNLFVTNYYEKFNTEDIEDYFYNISMTSRMFSYNFDTLLNGLIRHRDINNKILKYIEYGDLYGKMSESVGEYFSWICKSIKYPLVLRGANHSDTLKLISQLDREPFTPDTNFGNLSPELYKKFFKIWTNYIDDCYQVLIQLYNNLLLFKIKLPEKMTVYRGLYLDPSNTYDFTKMTGFTSTTYDIFTAIQIMFSNYDNQKELKILDYCYLLEIELPSGTNFYSTNNCTIQIEHEIILTDEGMLTNRKEHSYQMEEKTWFECKNSKGQLYPKGYQNLQFKCIKCKFVASQAPERPDFKNKMIESTKWGQENMEKVIAAIQDGYHEWYQDM